MSTKLSLKTETVMVLDSAELDQVAGGVAALPTSTAVTTFRRHRRHHPKTSSVMPTSTAVSSVEPTFVSSIAPTATAVSSALK